MFGVPRFLRLGKRASQLVIILYIAVTLYVRMAVEHQLNGLWLLSVIVGAMFLLVLWAMIKVRILNPGWLGADSRD